MPSLDGLLFDDNSSLMTIVTTKNFCNSNLARIERSAEKQAKSGTEDAGWYEKWYTSSILSCF